MFRQGGNQVSTCVQEFCESRANELCPVGKCHGQIVRSFPVGIVRFSMQKSNCKFIIFYRKLLSQFIIIIVVFMNLKCYLPFVGLAIHQPGSSVVHVVGVRWRAVLSAVVHQRQSSSSRHADVIVVQKRRPNVF